MNFLVPSKTDNFTSFVPFHGFSVLNFSFVYLLLAVEGYSGCCWFNQGAGDDFATVSFYCNLKLVVFLGTTLICPSRLAKIRSLGTVVLQKVTVNTEYFG